MTKTFEVLGEAYQASYEEFRSEISGLYPELDRWELLTIANFVYDNNLNKADVRRSLSYLTWKLEDTTKDLKTLVKSLNDAENIRSDLHLSKNNISSLIRSLKYRGFTYDEICGIITYRKGENPFINTKVYCASIMDSAKRYLVSHADMEG